MNKIEEISSTGCNKKIEGISPVIYNSQINQLITQIEDLRTRVNFLERMLNVQGLDQVNVDMAENIK